MGSYSERIQLSSSRLLCTGSRLTSSETCSKMFCARALRCSASCSSAVFSSHGSGRRNLMCGCSAAGRGAAGRSPAVSSNAATGRATRKMKTAAPPASFRNATAAATLAPSPCSLLHSSGLRRNAHHRRRPVPPRVTSISARGVETDRRLRQIWSVASSHPRCAAASASAAPSPLRR